MSEPALGQEIFTYQPPSCQIGTKMSNIFRSCDLRLHALINYLVFFVTKSLLVAIHCFIGKSHNEMFHNLHSSPNISEIKWRRVIWTGDAKCVWRWQVHKIFEYLKTRNRFREL